MNEQNYSENTVKRPLMDGNARVVYEGAPIYEDAKGKLKADMENIVKAEPYFVGSKPVEKRSSFNKLVNYVKENAWKVVLTTAVTIGVATVGGWALVKKVGEKVAERAAEKVLDAAFDNSNKFPTEFSKAISEIVEESKTQSGTIDGKKLFNALNTAEENYISGKLIVPTFSGTPQQFENLAPLMLTLTEHYQQGNIERNFASMQELSTYLSMVGSDNSDMKTQVSFTDNDNFLSTDQQNRIKRLSEESATNNQSNESGPKIHV